MQIVIKKTRNKPQRPRSGSTDVMGGMEAGGPDSAEPRILLLAAAEVLGASATEARLSEPGAVPLSGGGGCN